MLYAISQQVPLSPVYDREERKGAASLKLQEYAKKITV